MVNDKQEMATGISRTFRLTHVEWSQVPGPEAQPVCKTLTNTLKKVKRTTLQEMKRITDPLNNNKAYKHVCWH